MLQLVKKIDFRFAFSTTNLAAGNFVQNGDAAAYDVWDGERWINQYQLDEQSIAEICGVELIGPIDPTGVRDKLQHVRIRIDGEEYKEVSFNEMMAPPFDAYEPNSSPFFGYGHSVRVGDGYEPLPASLCFNMGVPMLLGGAPTEAVPKVGPGMKIGVEVAAPRAAEGGAAVANDLIVRLSVVQCRTPEMFKKLGAHYGWLSGNTVDQKFVFQDLEENGDIAEYTVDKTVDMAEAGAGLSLGPWTELYGGLDAKKPYCYNYIRYANNAQATTTNSEFSFTRTGSRVLHDEQEMDWNFDKGEALRLTHIGVAPHANHDRTRVFISGRDSNPYESTTNNSRNHFPMPAERTQPPNHYQGPASLGRGLIIWNNKGSVGVVDNGTSIPAWGNPPVRGTTVAIWGKHYKFT